MSKRRRTVDPKGRTPDQKQYAAFSYRMIRSDAWRSLSGPALKVYLEIRSRYNGGNNGALHLSLDEAKRLLGIGKTTAQRAFDELEDKGFVRMKQRGRWYGRKATEWAVTDCPVNGENATNDWKRWTAPKNNLRSPAGTIETPDGPASGPKNAPRSLVRTGQDHIGDSHGSGWGPLLSPRGSRECPEHNPLPPDWNPAGRIFVVRGPFGTGSSPSKRMELYRTNNRPLAGRDEMESDWNPIGRVGVVVGPFDPGSTHPVERQERYRGAL